MGADVPDVWDPAGSLLPQRPMGRFLAGSSIRPPMRPAVTGWIFVQGRNHMLRRVEVAHAADRLWRGSSRQPAPQMQCRMPEPGQEVRITAHQDRAGEWRAKRVEILKTDHPLGETPVKAGTLPNFTHFRASLDNQPRRILHRIVYGRNLIKVRVRSQRYNECVLQKSSVRAGVCL